MKLDFEAISKLDGGVIGGKLTDYNTAHGTLLLEEVITDSIHMFTGIEDREGQRIFEGDRIMFYHKPVDEWYFGLVKMNKLGCWSVKADGLNLIIPLFNFIENQKSLVSDTEWLKIAKKWSENYILSDIKQ